MANGSLSVENAQQNRKRQAVPDSELDERLWERPTVPREDILETICESLRAGIPLMQICRRKGMPTRGTVYSWRRNDPQIAERITRARTEGTDALIEESIEIVDDGSNDYLDREFESGRIQRVLDSEHVSRSKLRAEHRLKVAGLWNRAEYGAKTDVNVSGQLTLEALVLASLPQPADPPAALALRNITPAPAHEALRAPNAGHDPDGIEDLL